MMDTSRMHYKSRIFLSSCAVLLALATLAPPASGDAIIVSKAMEASTIAEIFIADDSIRVELEIGIRDLAAFRNLMPDDIYVKMGYDPEPFSDRLGRFFTEDLTIRAGQGKPITGRITMIEPRTRIVRDISTGEPLPSQDDSGEIVVAVTIIYPLRGHPDVMRIKPPGGGTGYTSAGIGFQVYHRGLYVNDFRYLSGEEVLRLDWKDPWYSQFDNRNLRRYYYYPIMTFLYIEPFEVRKEIVLRPKDLDHWLDLGLEDSEIIPVEKQEELKRRVAAFLEEKTPVKIDGRDVEGKLDRIHFIYRTLRTSGVIEPPEDLDAVSATLGVIFVYPTDSLPRQVTMDWQLFGGRIEQINASAVDEAGGMPSFLSPDDPVLTWTNYLKNPTIPGLVDILEPPRRNLVMLLAALVGILVLVQAAFRATSAIRKGERPSVWIWIPAAVAVALLVFAIPQGVIRPRLPADEVGPVVAGLLENIYSSFEFKDEERIYDSLARSAAGDILGDIYLETRRSLELKNQGGARAKVKTVEILSADSEPLDGELGFEALCDWKITGSVLHWGHVHSRINSYRARFMVKAIEGVWKITDLELLEETRVDPNALPDPAGGQSGT
jgi:hypothetical protein